MAFPQNFLEEIKNRIAVSDIVGQRVKLQRRGREYVGLSPFKQERTPSFTINDDKQFYHCFSTGKHGSVFDFLMETEGLGFPEAVERLAQLAGLPMPENDPREAQIAAKQTSLIDVTEAAAVWFASQLKTSSEAAEAARVYLQKRGVSAALIERFNIGYAPGARTGLVEHLSARKFSLSQIVEVGMAIQPDEGTRQPYDRFRDRIIFPIHDTRGRVIAFGGRALDPDAKAKYLNSPETPLFHKGAVLFNFVRARTPAYEAGTVLITEGYMDVVGLARAGIDHAVAPLGTAITQEQIRLAWRMAPEPILCLDGDEAGLRAAYRTIDRALPLLKPGYSLRFAILPPGKDPDDLVSEGGASVMNQVLGKAMSLVDLMWEREIEAAPWDTPERAGALKQRLRTVVGQVAHADLRDLFGQEIKSRLDKLLGAPGLSTRYEGRFEARDAKPVTGRRARLRQRTSSLQRMRGASSELRRSELAQGVVDIPQREAVILLGILNHPDILSSYRDMLENIDFSAPALDKLRFEIIDYFDRLENPPAGLDIEALKGHFTSQGMMDLYRRLMDMQDARILDFVHEDSALADVLPDWLEVVRVHHKLRTLKAEQRAIEEELVDEMQRSDTQEVLPRLIAIKNEIEALG